MGASAASQRTPVDRPGLEELERHASSARPPVIWSGVRWAGVALPFLLTLVFTLAGALLADMLVR